MFKKIFLFVLLGAFLQSCNNDEVVVKEKNTETQKNTSEVAEDNTPNVKIKGIVNGGEHSNLVLEANTNQGTVFISETMTNEAGEFDFDGKIKGIGLYQLRLNDGNSQNPKAIPLTLIPGDEVTIEVDFNDFMSPKYSGTEWAEAVTKYMEYTGGFVKWQQKVIAEGNKSQDELLKLAMKEYRPFEKYTQERIRENPSSASSILLMTNLFPIFGYENYDLDNIEIIKSIHAAYKQNYPESPITTNIGEQIVSVERGLNDFQNQKIRIGGLAPEIELPNPDGKMTKLSSLRGNYVLIDFWASWCKPCRMENPNVVNLYNKYKDKNFEIFSVSLDKDKEQWLRAIKDDNLTWSGHVSDLKFWNTPMVQLYEFNAIPYTVFLDPEGRIIEENLRGPSLERKLQEIFGS